MSAIVDLLLERRQSSGTYRPAQWFIDWVTGGSGSESSAGVKVNQSSALKYTPFWAAVRIISGTLAALPFIVYERTKEGGKKRINEHTVYNLLHNRPNSYMDAITFLETRQANVLTYGNGYAEIQRDGTGRPIALWPLLPDRTHRKIYKGKFYYEIRIPTGETIYLPDYNVLHIKGLGFDGYTGYDVVTYHKEAIGYGVAVKEFGSRFFGNGANAGGIYETTHTLSDKARTNLEKTLSEEYIGLSKAHRLMILEEGLKYSKTGVDPQQAQAIEVQKYTVDDCSRIFIIPPHKLGSLDRATFSNIEEQNLDFYSCTMLYWFRKWEEECNYKLFMPSEQKKLFCEILVDGLLRGKITDRYTAYNTGRQAGFLCVNDIRNKENMNPIGPEGDIFLEPLNMKPAGTPTPLPKEMKEEIQKAHRDLLISQWLRIIRKQKNCLDRGVKSDFYDSQRNYARTILYEPVNAYASTIDNGRIDIRNILEKIINKAINSNKKLMEDDAGRLADRIMEEIGDNLGA